MKELDDCPNQHLNRQLEVANLPKQFVDYPTSGIESACDALPY